MKLNRTNTFLYTLFLFVSIGLWACEDNELDVNAEWKETMIVYGLLDVNADTQFIRVQKAFLNPDQSALEVAQITDSIYLKNLEVIVTEETGRVITFSPIQREKDTGLFANQPNILYYSTEEIDANRSYSLQITNTETGNVVTSKTDIVRNALNFLPISNNVTNSFLLSPGTNTIYSFTAGVNAKIYDFLFRFYYREIDKDGTDSVTKSLDWRVLNSRRLTSASGGSKINFTLNGELFFDYLKNTLPIDSTINRKMLHVDLFYYGGAEDLDIYLSVNRPSIGIVQKKPEYTNIDNGLGIFSSRNIQFIDSVRVNGEVINYLINRNETRPLNFVH